MPRNDLTKFDGMTPGKWQAEPFKLSPSGHEADCGIVANLGDGHGYAVARCPRYQTKEQWESDSAAMTSVPELIAEIVELRAENERLEAAAKEGGGTHRTKPPPACATRSRSSAYDLSDASHPARKGNRR